MCRRQQRLDEGEQPLDAAAIRLDDLFADRADAPAFGGIIEQPQQQRRQLMRIGYLQGRTLPQQQPRNVLAVLMRRAGQHRQTQRSRLEQIVSADRHQAAADESHLGRRI